MFEVKNNASGSVTQFLYDGDALVAEYDSNGNITNRYLHGSRVDEPYVWYPGNSVGAANRRNLYTDHQGSIAAVTNSAAVVQAINTYDAYGIPGGNNLGRFAGQIYLPEVGLQYYKARMYFPALGRFLQTDPIGYEDQMNLYAYVGNDPLNKNDPTGEFANFLIGAGVGIAAELIVQTVVEGKSFSEIDGGKILQSAAVGAISGGVGGATTKLAGSIGRSVVAPASAMHQGASKVATGAATGAIGGATGAAVGDASKQLAETGTVDPGKITQAAITGAVTGGLSGAAGGAYQANAAQKTLGDTRAQTVFTSAQPGAAGAAVTSGIVDATASTADTVNNACQQKPNGC